MEDLINRHAAIDAMCELMHHWFGGDPKDEVREINRELGKLPSAQPEFIRCKECKYSEEDEDEHGIVDRWCRIWAETCTDDGYCNYAERE